MNAEGAPSAFTLAGPWVDVAATGEAVTSLGSVPLSGTSYAAPVVSGLAALIRARFPTLTARQVMQRIESTAHHPPAGWDPFVGNGTVDVLAAVSTDSMPPANTPKPPPVPVPPTAPPPPQATHLPRPRHRTAWRGHLPGRSAGSAAHRCGQGSARERPATVSRATDAFALTQFRSRRQCRQHRPGDRCRRRWQTEIARRVIVMDREPHPGVGDEVPRAAAAFGPDVGAPARAADRPRPAQDHRPSACDNVTGACPAGIGRPGARQERDAGMAGRPGDPGRRRRCHRRSAPSELGRGRSLRAAC